MDNLFWFISSKHYEYGRAEVSRKTLDGGRGV